MLNKARVQLKFTFEFTHESGPDKKRKLGLEISYLNAICEVMKPATSPQHKALTAMKTQASASCSGLLADQIDE